MKMHSHYSWVALCLILLIFSLACNFLGARGVPIEPQVEPATVEPEEQPTLETDPTEADEDEIVPTPRKLRPFNFNSSNEDGTCGSQGNVDDLGNEYDCAVVFSDNAFIEFKIFKNGQEIGQADGVQQVVFSVTQNDNDDNTETIYTHPESSAPYCIFGGDSTCNSWVLEDDIYKWEPGGSSLETGVYHVDIVTYLDELSVVLAWNADITVTSP